MSSDSRFKQGRIEMNLKLIFIPNILLYSNGVSVPARLVYKCRSCHALTEKMQSNKHNYKLAATSKP